LKHGRLDTYGSFSHGYPEIGFLNFIGFYSPVSVINIDNQECVGIMLISDLRIKFYAKWKEFIKEQAVVPDQPRGV
jgi:hypothetical protein